MTTKVNRIDVAGPLRRADRTPQGGLKAPAYLTRTGVFVYRKADGSEFRELRHPDEVFAPESLASLRGAPLTVDHPSEAVTASNWRNLSVGHVSDDVHQDDRFVAATVLIQDGGTVDGVERGDYRELSCGYTCGLDMTPGEYNGEKYDAKQTGIVYNHVAIGLASDWGRAGPEVRLRVDSQTAVARVDGPTEPPTKLPGMASENTAPEATPATPDTTVADLTAKLDAKSGECAALVAKVAELEAAAAKARSDAADAVSPARVDALVASRLKLIQDAKSLDEKVDATGKNERDLMCAALATVHGDFKADGKSDEWVRGCFDAAVSLGAKAHAAQSTARETIDAAVTTPAVDPIVAAAERAAEKSRNAWKHKS